MDFKIHRCVRGFGFDGVRDRTHRPRVDGVCVYRVHNYVPDHDSLKATSDLTRFVRVYSIVLRLVMIGQSSVLERFAITG